MPQSASLSPQPPQHAPPAAAMQQASPNNNASAMRPPMMRKQSSQSSHSGRQQHILSPGSATEHNAHPLRHPVRTAGRHAKVLPRNHSSARNLAKLTKNVQHARERSHEGDTEIRLPGSLDESVSSVKPPMRRNLTAYQLPRNTSHAKLKKNLSHGQLTRLGSGKNLAALGQQRAPPSPGLKGKSKRPKSAEMTGIEDIALVQERRPPAQRKNSTKKVGFAVGSAGDSSGDDEALQMEGSGLQEDEWTEDSASASPYSTRQNTANNSRRTSVVVDKTAEKLNRSSSRMQEYKAKEEKREREETEDETDEDDSDAPSPLTMGQGSKTSGGNVDRAEQQHRETRQPESKETQQQPVTQQQAPISKPPPQRSPLHLAKEYTNPTTQRLLDKNHQLPAPALVSNVSALDDTHSSRGSPAPSLRSSEQQEDELVSRFVPSGSHPSLGSGPTTAVNTPKQTEFHTPEEDSTLRREKHTSGFQIGPVSPGSTISSGATTPAVGRSRTELRMLNEKALADMESQADPRPQLPAHVYDRRNESLRLYFGRPPSGPEVFQGRFRALNTELRVVQKFRDPIGEAIGRLRGCKGSRLNNQRMGKANTLPMSKSAVSLPVGRRMGTAADLAKSASPPKSGLVGSLGNGERQKGRREVSFARTPPETKEYVPAEEELSADGVARRMWESVG